MVKIDLGLTDFEKKEYTSRQHYEKNYEEWRGYRKQMKEPFMMVPSDVLNYVSSIRSRAINLYLYYCSRANNSTGKSWPSVEKAADDLGISSKSVNNWNKELETLGLIARINEGKSSKTTYLLPVSDYYYLEKNITPEKFYEFSEEKIDGKLLGIINLFQWRKGKSQEYIEPYNITCLLFQRSHEPMETNMNKKIYKITKAVLFEEEKYRDIRIDKTAEDFSSKYPLYIFDMEKQSYAEDITKIGVALSTKINLKEDKNLDEVLDIIKQLAQGIEEGSLTSKPKAKIV